MALASPTAQADMLHFLENEARLRLPNELLEGEQATTSSRLWALLRAAEPWRSPDTVDLARSLEMSRRTPCRRLALEGTSVKAPRDALRRRSSPPAATTRSSPGPAASHPWCAGAAPSGPACAAWRGRQPSGFARPRIGSAPRASPLRSGRRRRRRCRGAPRRPGPGGPRCARWRRSPAPAPALVLAGGTRSRQAPPRFPAPGAWPGAPRGAGPAWPRRRSGSVRGPGWKRGLGDGARGPRRDPVLATPERPARAPRGAG